VHFKTVENSTRKLVKRFMFGTMQIIKILKNKESINFLRHGLRAVLPTAKDQTMKNSRRLTVYYGNGM